MLSRAARRRLSQSQPPMAERLALPWLCPAQMRWATCLRSTTPTRLHSTTSAPTAAAYRRPARQESPPQTRTLATQAEASPAAERFPPPPFPGLGQAQAQAQAWATRKPDPQLSKLQPWPDTARPLVVHDALSSLAVPTSSYNCGIGGDPVELHQNLYACLRVGRMDRAQAILTRLSKIYSPDAPEAADSHSSFLTAMFEQLEQQPSPAAMENLENWYLQNVVAQAIEPNAQMLVTLLRASMTLLEGEVQTAAVRRYLALAQRRGPAVLEQVNASPDFSDAEWDVLIRLQSDAFEEPPSVEEVLETQISTPGGRALAIEHGLIPDPALLIKPVDQKGLGLSSLKQALALFETADAVPYPHETEGSQEEKDRAYAYMRQIRIEQDSTKAATERWKAEDGKLQDMGIHGVLQSKPIQALMWRWYSALVPNLEAEIKRCKDVLSKPVPENVRDVRHLYGPYLEHAKPARLAAMAISSIMGAMVKNGRENEAPQRLAGLSVHLGRAVEKDFNESLKVRYESFLLRTRRQTRRELLTKLSKDKATAPAVSNDESAPRTDAVNNAFRQKEMPLHIQVSIGAILLENIIQSAMITLEREDPKTGLKATSTQPAFQYNAAFSNGKLVGSIVPHPQVVQKLRTEPLFGIQTVKLPMLVEPKPWTSYTDGGYYTYREVAVRAKSGDIQQKAYAISAIDNGDMKKVLAGLDTLGRVPWNINSEVFTVMAETWNNGEGIGGLVPETLDLQRPAEVSCDAPFVDRMKHTRDLKEYENVKAGHHSQRCFQNFQLETARAFLKEKFFYPHSVDFRGRAYPIPPVLNHIGADFSRGLLLFANGKELGEVGLQWLKVHLANLYGYDKASLKDRESFAMDHIKEVYDSATNPLGGNRWWTNADDPWQCLACCIELKKALDSPDPTRFVSHLPVHQDGTCNGLQHYAALGGDEAGASQVNLEPSDKPQDIYTGVAEMVKDMVTEDAKNGNPVAKFMEGKIVRSVVKRTVMTNVYGVTFIGAKTQVLDELKRIFPNFQPIQGVQSLGDVAFYVARKIFLALGNIFNGAQEIQCWLGACGERITMSLSTEQIKSIKDRYEGAETKFEPKYNQAKKLSAKLKSTIEKNSEAFKTSIIWTTPLKMPVVQPYRKDKIQLVQTSLARISVARNSETEAVNKRKQLQAFPPNFIHSLDATHMTLSALRCAELGLDFAAVHDSFWTHAADIPSLNIVLRDAFVRMHSEDIIGRLAAEFKARYAGSMYAAPVKLKTRVASEILEWRRTYGKNHNHKRVTFYDAPVTEIALEAQRLELLNSTDPVDKEKGEQMVTPTSIWLRHHDPSSLASPKIKILGELDGSKNKKVEELQTRLLESEMADKPSVAAASDNASLEAQDVKEPEAEEEEQKANAESIEELETEDIDDEPPAKKTATGAEMKPTTNMLVWLPLTFPPVPKKGTWDVQRLRESKYFFS